MSKEDPEKSRLHTPGYEPIITEKDFTEIMLPAAKEKAAILFVNAPWCGPCRAMQPIMAELARDYKGKFSFWELCTDEPDFDKINKKYGIRCIPAVLVLKDDRVIEQITGAVSRSFIENAMKKAL